MGSSKPQPRGKQRRDQNKAKPVVQQHAQPRAAHVAPATAPRETPSTQAPAPQPHINRVPANPARNDATRPTFKPLETPAPPFKASTGAHPPQVDMIAPAPQIPTEPSTIPPSAAPVAPPRAAQESVSAPRHTGQKTPTPPSELSPMFAELRELFVHDRANGARGDAARCGVCYLTFPRDQLTYREDEGFYACPACATALGKHTLPMLRRQRK